MLLSGGKAIGDRKMSNTNEVKGKASDYIDIVYDRKKHTLTVDQSDENGGYIRTLAQSVTLTPADDEGFDVRFLTLGYKDLMTAHVRTFTYQVAGKTAFKKNVVRWYIDGRFVNLAATEKTISTARVHGTTSMTIWTDGLDACVTLNGEGTCDCVLFDVGSVRVVR